MKMEHIALLIVNLDELKLIFILLIHIDFYCDTYAAGGQISTVVDKGSDFRILDISEPDWCSYLFKVSTKYMCTGVAQLPKASHRVNGGAASRLQRKDVAL